MHRDTDAFEGRLNRRSFARFAAGAAVAALAGPVLAATEEEPLHDYVPDSQDLPRLLRRISGLHTEHWQNHFNSISQDAILVNVDDRVLHYWGSDGFYRIYPTSVPLTEEMTRRGRTSITLKRENPDWRPTPAMLKRRPDLPLYEPPGPDNPLGIRALNLGWPSYRIHGTNDIRKIGRQSSSGCIGLFNEHILEVYGRAQIGTPVLLI
jgi:L,D-transpeptidase ErfK/SrfK